jgi:hypothetical protein
MKLEELPCLECVKPQALDVRHMICTGAIWEACNQSPGGLPLACCRIRIAGVMPTSDRPRPQSPR